MEILRKVWQGWKRVAQLIGDFIGRFILSVFYFTLFMPFGIAVRLWGDPMDIKTRKKVHWLERSTHDLSLHDVRRLS